jgi:hypothetical protein
VPLGRAPTSASVADARIQISLNKGPSPAQWK